MSKANTGAEPSLDAVRQRIDALDTELLRLVDERASLARVVAAAKRAAGDGDKFALRPAREAAILRRLIGSQRTAASPGLIVRIWREMIGDSLSVQGPFHLSVWGAAIPAARSSWPVTASAPPRRYAGPQRPRTRSPRPAVPVA